MITFNSSEAPLSPGDLLEVEQNFGFTLPQAFRELYLKFNGGAGKGSFRRSERHLHCA